VTQNGDNSRVIAGVIATGTVDSWFDGAGTAAAAENTPGHNI